MNNTSNFVFIIMIFGFSIGFGFDFNSGMHKINPTKEQLYKIIVSTNFHANTFYQFSNQFSGNNIKEW